MIQLLANTRSKEYPIYLSGGALEESGSLWRSLGRGGKVTIITDSNVAGVCLSRVEASFRTAGVEVYNIIVDAGERAKSISQASQLYSRLFDMNMRRCDTVCALGGGVVGDLAGFVASTYMRGIGLIQIPTTLLSQVDSSIGGKVGINIEKAKNYVGSFYQPDIVITDPDLLRTLPPEQLSEGLAEVVKYTLLSGEDFFVALEASHARFQGLDMAFVEPVVRRCIEYKLAVVSEDERDRGRRAVLNLGHSVGHGIEAAGRYGAYSHGQAVALGLLAALQLSHEVLQLDTGYRDRLRVLLEALGLPVRLEGVDTAEVLSAMASDKKADDTSANMVLLRELGEPVINCDGSTTQLEYAVNSLMAVEQGR